MSTPINARQWWREQRDGIKLLIGLLIYFLFFFVWPFFYEEEPPTVTQTIEHVVPFAPDWVK